MSFKRLVFLFIAILITSSVAYSQMIEDPCTWTYEVKKKGGHEYQLIVHLDIKKGWHIWSLNPGGDGYEIAPTFNFDKNPNVKLKGGVTEKGKKTVTKMAGIEGLVTYYTGKTDYVQEATVTGKTKITGIHSYQVCNDKMCLPPKDKNFVFEIK